MVLSSQTQPISRAQYSRCCQQLIYRLHSTTATAEIHMPLLNTKPIFCRRSSWMNRRMNDVTRNLLVLLLLLQLLVVPMELTLSLSFIKPTYAFVHEIRISMVSKSSNNQINSYHFMKLHSTNEDQPEEIDTSVTNIDATSQTTSSSSSSTNIDIELEQQINQGLQRAKAVLEKSRKKLAALQVEKDKQLDDSSVVVTDTVDDEAIDSIPFFASKQRTFISSASSMSTMGSSATATIQEKSTVVTGLKQQNNNNNNNMNLKVKSKNDDTGLIMADGERMAEISEYEPWEYRTIYEMFNNQPVDDNDDDNTEINIRQYNPIKDNNNNDHTNNNNNNNKNDDDDTTFASIYNLRKVLQVQDYRTIFDSNNFLIGEDN